jgi:hypothetical protein
MQVTLGGRQVAVAEQFGQRGKIDAGLEQGRREGGAQRDSVWMPPVFVRPDDGWPTTS